MILFYPGSIQILGTDANGANVILCKMAVDDIANLPAYNAFAPDNVLSMGCTAIAINDNSKHRLNSAGQWVQIQAGTSTYTRAEIDTLLSAKQDMLTFDTIPTENSTNPVTSNGIYQAFINNEIPSTIPGTMSIYDLAAGWWSRTSNLSQVSDTPSDYSGGYICHVLNMGIGSPRRKMIDFYPISAANVGTFYRAVQTANGWSAWYRYDGTQVV